MNSINAGTTAYLTVAPLDNTGAPAAPTTATFRVDDLATSTNLITTTSLTPSTSMLVTLTSVATATVNNALTPQIRAVTINMVYGTNDQLNLVYLFQIVPLQF